MGMVIIMLAACIFAPYLARQYGVSVSDSIIMAMLLVLAGMVGRTEDRLKDFLDKQSSADKDGKLTPKA